MFLWNAFLNTWLFKYSKKRCQAKGRNKKGTEEGEEEEKERKKGEGNKERGRKQKEERERKLLFSNLY